MRTNKMSWLEKVTLENKKAELRHFTSKVHSKVKRPSKYAGKWVLKYTESDIKQVLPKDTEIRYGKWVVRGKEYIGYVLTYNNTKHMLPYGIATIQYYK